MEKSVLALVRIILVALVTGLLVVLFHPLYRGTARAMLRGEPASSPIWKSNAEYYRDVGFVPEDHDAAE